MRNKEEILKEIAKGSDDAEMEIISLGLGVQSTALYFMSCLGDLPRADYAIFSDTGAEHKYTYEYLSYLQKFQKENNGIPIIVVKNKEGLYKDSLKDNLVRIPAYVEFEDGTSIMNRSCTKNYKIDPFYRKIRELLGLKKGERSKKKVNAWIGITVDEIQRVKESSVPLLVNRYPFIGMLWKRSDCINYYIKHNFPSPKKSSCVFCPYQSDSSFLDMKKNHKQDWNKAIKVDEYIRNRFTKEGQQTKSYIWKRYIPIKDAHFENEEQVDMFENECEGHCGL